MKALGWSVWGLMLLFVVVLAWENWLSPGAKQCFASGGTKYDVLNWTPVCMKIEYLK